MGVERLDDRLYRLLLGRFQAYVWRDPEGVTLIDTGAADTGGELALALDEIGLAPTDIDRVVLTHYHDDHAGGAAEIRDWGGSTVIAHHDEAAVLRGDAPRPVPTLGADEQEMLTQFVADLPPAPPVEVDQEVEDGDVLDFGGGAHVVAVPGHTDGSIALHLPAHRVLFAGDAATEHLGRVMLGVFNTDSGQAAESLARLADLDADIALFGHGQPALADAGELFRQAVEAMRRSS